MATKWRFSQLTVLALGAIAALAALLAVSTPALAANLPPREGCGALTVDEETAILNNVTGTQGVFISVNVTLCDYEDGQQNLTYTVTQTPASMWSEGFNATGDLQLYNVAPPNAMVGWNLVSVRICDTAAACTDVGFLIWIANANDPPVMPAYSSINVTQDQTFTAPVIMAADPDVLLYSVLPQAEQEALTYSDDCALFNVVTISRVNVVTGEPEDVGQIRITATNEEVGDWDCLVTVTDVTGATDSLPVHVRVNNENDAPQSVHVNVTDNNESTTKTVSVYNGKVSFTVNHSLSIVVVVDDPDLHPRLVDPQTAVDPAELITCSILVTHVYGGSAPATGPLHKPTINSTTCTSDFTPGMDEVGVFSITFTARDNQQISVTFRMRLEILEEYHGPIVNDSAYMLMAEDGGPAFFSLDDLATDPDNDTLVFEPVGDPNFNVTVEGGMLRVEPAMDFETSSYGYPYRIYVNVTDGTHQAMAGIVVNVTAVLDAPRVLSTAVAVACTEDTPCSAVDLTLVFFDPDDPTRTHQLQYMLSGYGDFEFNIVGDMLWLTPAQDWSGARTVQIQAMKFASVGSVVVPLPSDIVEIDVSVVEVNDAPRVETRSPLETAVNVSEGASLGFSIDAVDPEHGAVTYRWYVDDVLQASTLASFTLFAAYDTATPGHPAVRQIAVFASDAMGAEVTQAWTVTVDDTARAPTVSILSPVEGVVYQNGRPVALVASAIDPDGDALQFWWTNSLGTQILDTAEGLYTFSGVGIGRVTLRVSDGVAVVVWSVNVTIAVGSDTMPIVAVQSEFAWRDGPGNVSLRVDVTGLEAPVEVHWLFGDGTVGDGAAVNHTYGESGRYHVAVTVTDGYGSQWTQTGEVVVEREPPLMQHSGPPPGLPVGLILVSAVVAVAVGALIYTLRRRR